MQYMKFRWWPGVYGGIVLLCLRCNVITYIPASPFEQAWMDLETREHMLLCPVVVDEGLAQLLGYVNPGESSSGTVEQQGD